MSSTSDQNDAAAGGGGGCAWGLLHIIKYHHWRHVKIRLTHKRPHLSDPGNDVDVPTSSKMEEHDHGHMDESILEGESRDSSLGKNSSVKARIKQFLAEEMHKKKNRHNRSSSCPVRSHLTRTDSFHHLELAYLDSLAGTFESDDQSPISVEKISEISSASNQLDSLPMSSTEEPTTSSKRFVKCNAMVVEDQSEHDQVDEHQNKLFENQTFLHGELDNTTENMLRHNSIHERKRSVDALANHPKEYLNALDIISVNKELLLKILQDPGSPLAHHFSNQQALGAKRGLDKCEAFPSPVSLGKRGTTPSRLKQMQKADCIRERNQAIAESSNNPSAASAKHRKNQRETRAVLKRFKDLRKKIKHVIREGRKDRHIITMDAVIHKIPHGRKVEEEIDNQIKNSAICQERKDFPGSVHVTESSLNKNRLGMRQMRRASSLTESLDRYSMLYQTNFNREAKHQTPEGLKIRVKEGGSPYTSVPKYLARIYSLPDLKSFLDHEESSNTFSLEVPTNSVVDHDVSTRSSNEEQTSLDLTIGSEDQLQTDDHRESVFQKASVEIGAINSVSGDQLALTPISNNVENAQLGESVFKKPSVEIGAINFVSGDQLALTPISNNEENTRLGSHMHDYGSLTAEESEIEPVLLDELANLAKQCEKGEEEPDMGTPQVSEVEIYEEMPGKHLMEEISHLQVDAKDKAEFSYVRDVLELSGFSGNAFLGTWHSDEQPVNPLVYEEVEGCLVLDPDCCGNEGGQCDHLLLFDLINEVLMEIYARSYSYCPFPLSSLSHISPMPAGSNVLREVWSLISWYLSLRTEFEQSLDYVVGSDLAKSYGWMNLQFDTECVGIELEDLIFDDLLEEVICT
ncbi:hypothetical protein PanWU01x14_311520 [Parasponia andersonii]|uniref:DUF4378 domain-containing protein n=1 Tax=Parasponia andersonii TaxID=3476 RepID=A0A2P5APX9_PARAD|nr:hypothetical protein PanWU01x14_311520 [Parasponia andersonii]